MGLSLLAISAADRQRAGSYSQAVEELYDVAVLPGVRQAEAIGFRGEEIQHQITVE